MIANALKSGRKMKRAEAEALESKTKWILCTDQLPKIRYDVLITVWFHGTRQTKLGYRQQGEWMFWHEGNLESYLDEENKVIAWSPLPDPYCGETYKGEFMTPPVETE